MAATPPAPAPPRARRPSRPLAPPWLDALPVAQLRRDVVRGGDNGGTRSGGGCKEAAGRRGEEAAERRGEETGGGGEEGAPDFDILRWWEVHGPKYPVLSCIARDVLAIQASTVASESSFSAGGRIITDHRSRLKSEIVEALICLQDWLKAADPKPISKDVEEEKMLGVLPSK